MDVHRPGNGIGQGFSFGVQPTPQQPRLIRFGRDQTGRNRHPVIEGLLADLGPARHPTEFDGKQCAILLYL